MRKLTGRALFGALFKKLLRRAETFCYTKNSKKSTIGLCTSSLHKTFHATVAGTEIGTWKASLKSVDNFHFIDSCCLFPEACRSSTALTVTMKMVRLLDLMWYSLSPISDLIYQTSCNFHDVRPVLRSIPHIQDHLPTY